MAAKRLSTKRTPELETKIKKLNQDVKQLTQEKNNLVTAVSHNGPPSVALLQRLGEVEAKFQELTHDRDQAQAEIQLLKNQTIDETDLRAALSAFDPIWNELTSTEKARVLQLLIEKVTYNAQEGEVEITFRPSGVRTLAHDNERGESA